MDSESRENERINITLLKRELGEGNGISMSGIRRADEAIYRQADQDVVDAIAKYRLEYGPRGEDDKIIYLRACLNFAVRRIIASEKGSEQQCDHLSQLNKKLEDWLDGHNK